MLLIELAFPAGRYHATPWGHNVNEGLPEWPPSPYRLFRALYDAWKRKQSSTEESAVAMLFSRLASRPPWFYVPRATAAHIRYFLATGTKADPLDRQLVFDAFMAVDPQAPLLMGWPEVEISDPEQQLLSELLRSLSYLGRSESWVAARALEGTPPPWNCIPFDHAGERGGWEPVPVTGVRPLGRSESEAEWLAQLAYSTTRLLDERRDRPPLLEMQRYLLRADRLMPLSSRSSVGDQATCAVLYGLASRVPPRVVETIEVAERFRRKLMGVYRRTTGSDTPSPRFSGKDETGLPLRGHHRHAYFLPMDRDGDGFLDHLLVYCGEPFDEAERAALDRVLSLWQPNGRPDLRLVLLETRSPEAFSAQRVLRSRTPFVTYRHHRRGRGSFGEWLASEVQRQAGEHGIPEPTAVRPLPYLEAGGRPLRWLDFRRNRRGDPTQVGWGFEVELSEPVRRPVALGYGAHFGLGQLG